MEFPFKSYLKRGYSARSVEYFGLCFNVTDASWTGVKVKYVNGEIELLDVVVDCKLEMLKKHIKRATPVILSVIGKGVVTKQHNFPIDNPAIMMPGASDKNFLLQVFGQEEKIGALFRRDQFDNILTDLNAQGIFVQNSYLHALSVIGLALATQENGNREFVVCGKELVLAGESILMQNSTKASTEYPLDGFVLKEEALVAFAGVFQEVSYAIHCSILETPSLSLNQTEYSYNIKSGKLLQLGVIGMFGLLLINYFIYFKFESQLIELENYLSTTSNQMLDLNELEQKVAQRSRLASLTDMNSVYGLPFYMNRLAYECPETISLEMVEICPLKGKAKEGEILSFFKRRLQVKGRVNKSIVFNEWVRSLQKEEWVHELKVLDYEVVKDKGAHFLIVIEVL